MQFYVLYPLLLVSMFRLGKLTTFGLLAVVNVGFYWALERYGYQLFSSYYVSWYLGALVAEGEAMGLLSERLSSSRLRAAFYALGFAFLCAGCALFFLSSYVAFQVWAVAFAIFLFAVLKRPTELSGWASKSFSWLGTFSFSLYIIHLPVVVLIHSVFFNSVHQVSIAPFCATLVAAIGCAYAFSFIFERPALALSQMWKGKRHLVRAGPNRQNWKGTLHTFAAAHGPFDENRPGMDAAELAYTAMLGGTKTSIADTWIEPGGVLPMVGLLRYLVVCMTVILSRQLALVRQGAARPLWPKWPQ